MTNKLGLYDLLAPQFLLGFNFPTYINNYLSFLSVDELRSVWDDSAIVYTGQASFGGQGGALPLREHKVPGGGPVFRWQDVTLAFRLTVPREGSGKIKNAIGNLQDLKSLFEHFEPDAQSSISPDDFPGFGFRLELLVSLLTFHLGPKWQPGKVEDYRIVPDPSKGSDVRFVLPKMVLEYQQPADFQEDLSFRLLSWGNAGFEAPHDLEMGELVRMEPPIAIHQNGRFAFGVDQVLLDMSTDHTPPEILEFFGTDEAFQGLFFKSVNIFYEDPNKALGFNLAVRDMLISFDGEVSLEASLDIMTTIPLRGFRVKVRFYDGAQKIKFHRGKKITTGSTVTRTGGTVVVPNTGVIQVEARGGFPEYQIEINLTKDGTNPINLNQSVPGQADLASVPPETYSLKIKVTDDLKGYDNDLDNNVFVQNLTLKVVAAEMMVDGTSLDRPEQAGEREPATFTVLPPSVPTGYTLRHQPASEGIAETLTIEGGSDPVSLQIDDGSGPVIRQGRQHVLDVPHGTSLDLRVNWPASSDVEETFHLFFDVDRPASGGWSTVPPQSGAYAAYLTNQPNPHDSRFTNSRAPSGDLSLRGAAALEKWVEDRVIQKGGTKSVAIQASASFEQTTLTHHDLALSERRLDVAAGIIGARADIPLLQASGHQSAAQAGRTAEDTDRVARITGLVSEGTAAQTLKATLSRDPKQAPSPTVITSPAPMPRKQNKKHPPVIRRLSFRVRLERNVLVLLEFSGQIDFETKLEQAIERTPGVSPGNLNLTTPKTALNPNPVDGVVNFTLTITFDTATRQLTETLKLGAEPGDVDGLLQMKNDQNSTFKNVLGSLLTFSPLINKFSSAIDPGKAGDWVALGASLAVPATIAGVGIFKTRTATLYGGEMRARQYWPEDGSLEFTDAALIFDYGVEFDIEINALNIRNQQPLGVRYRAIGFNLSFDNPDVTYQPVFDTGKGYEIDLSDPGLIELPGGLGKIMKILGARIAKFNPIVLDFDLAMKVNLGVITVDRFKVKVPLDSKDPPMVLPSKISVDIPATLVGQGSVNLSDNGVNGWLDLTLVSLKLRVAASVAIKKVEEGGRKAVAVFVGMEVELPSPIVVGTSGLGIFGFTGLFAMHYRRTEGARDPNSIVGPSLKWLEKANGQPHLIEIKKAPSSGGGGSTGSGQSIQLWEPELDRWSFGVGMIMGTLDGGFVLNLRGMFVLELPGPRILIFIKLQLIKNLPELEEKDLTVGILGVIDLDFRLGTLTIGILVDLEIEKLIEIQIPIEVFFNTREKRDWHLWIGTTRHMVSALILGTVRARGYFMFDGKAISPFPPGSGGSLPGMALATGIEASLLIGNKKVGLYLEVAAGAHLGISFSPFLIAGFLDLRGTLRLFIVNIQASASLQVRTSRTNTYIEGEVCGKVKVLFVKLKGCVRLEIGSKPPAVFSPPPLIRNVYLQSFAPILSAGQGGERPIEASLGDAVPPSDGLGPIVPIDAVPVLQMHVSPRVQGAITFTLALGTPPGLTTGGWVDSGAGQRIRYRIKSLTLERHNETEIFQPPSGGKPPATWRREQAPGPAGTNTNIDLALFSRIPVTASRAVERSTDLTRQVKARWQDLCQQIAPPTCILWTFCRQMPGTSGEGWTVLGTPRPDPPNTRRSTEPDLVLKIEEPEPKAHEVMWNELLANAGKAHPIAARILGPRPFSFQEPLGGEELCINFTGYDNLEMPNPWNFGDLGFSSYRDGNLQSSIQIRTFNQQSGTLSGLSGVNRLDIQWQVPATRVTLTFAAFAPATISAFNSDGSPTGTADLNPPAGNVESRTFVGSSITKIEITGWEFILLECCYTAQSDQPTRDDECHRVLQLPYCRRSQGSGEIDLNPGIRRYCKGLRRQQWLKLHTGPAREIRIFLAYKTTFERGFFLAELDESGDTLRTRPLSSLIKTPITSVYTGLPANWLDPALPWHHEVKPAAEFMAEFLEMTRVLIEFDPHPDSETIQILTIGTTRNLPPLLLMGALEVCPQTEFDRAQGDAQIQVDEIETVKDWLGSGDGVPLLYPGSHYTLKAIWEAESNSNQKITQTQEFAFQTDNAPPARLSPYVLGTAPDDEENHVFYDDPLRVVFNDAAILQLFKAYGKPLKVALRSADGFETTYEDIDEAGLEKLDAQISTPYREALAALIEESLQACASGVVDEAAHGRYTVPIQLRPLMTYTLDIEVDPPDSPPSGPVEPLFRRTFSTSKFSSIDALLDELRAERVQHRGLTQAISGLPQGQRVNKAADLEIQEALRLAGEQVLPAAGRTGITVYWHQKPGQNHFSPHALLIDASEPLWRFRSEPRIETVPNQDDPAFKRAVDQQVPTLEIIEDSHVLSHFVRSPGGTRTLAFLDPSLPPSKSGFLIELAVHRPASALFDISSYKSLMFPDLVLMSRAPWEDDHV